MSDVWFICYNEDLQGNMNPWVSLDQTKTGLRLGNIFSGSVRMGIKILVRSGLGYFTEVSDILRISGINFKLMKTMPRISKLS